MFLHLLGEFLKKTVIFLLLRKVSWYLATKAHRGFIATQIHQKK